MSLNDNSDANANKGNCSSKQLSDDKQEWKEREVKEHNEVTNSKFEFSFNENNKEIDAAFVVFQFINNTINICEKLISKHNNGVDYFCSLCNCIIEHSSNDKKFRFSLWSHLNEETHTDKILHFNDNVKNKEKIKQSREQNKLASVQLKNALASFKLGKKEKKFTSKHFINKKSECNSYHCNLCDVEILYSSDNNELRFNLLSHINEENHKFQLATVIKTAACYKSRKTKKGHGLNKKSALKKCKDEDQRMNHEESNMGNIFKKCGQLSCIKGDQPSSSKVEICTNSKFVEVTRDLQALQTSEKEDIDSLEETKPDMLKALNKDLFRKPNRIKEELKKFLNSYQHTYTGLKQNKDFLYKFKKGNDYYCILCDVRISYPLNDNEFRFNLWSHINTETHMVKLPNYTDIVRSFETKKGKISESLPGSYKDDADYFIIGPMFTFAECSLCNVAVSMTIHCLTYHIKGREHNNNRRLAMRGQKVSNIPPQVRSDKEYAALRSRIDFKFSNDIRLIQPGKMSGYVICIACCQLMLATKFHVEKHFQLECHIENRWLRPVNKSDISLDVLLQYIPDDLKEYKDIFVRDRCGVSCSRCQEVIPATKCDVYKHINIERKRNIQSNKR